MPLGYYSNEQSESDRKRPPCQTPANSSRMLLRPINSRQQRGDWSRGNAAAGLTDRGIS